MTDARDHDLWWSALYHGGLLIAPSKLVEFFPAACPPLDDLDANRLRAHLARFAADPAQLGALLDAVLEDILSLDQAHWQKGSAVAAEWSVKLVTGETERPRRIWAPPHRARLPVFTDGEPTLGVGRGRRAVARVMAWLRATHQPIALLTNGRQWRLIHAALDHEAWCEWDTSLWFREGAAGPQLAALRILLGRDALRPGDDGELPLLAAIQATRQGQSELSAHLGERVRQAVERLIQASSAVIADHAPRSIYIAATRLIMRCVVLLFAEARGGEDRPLLPRDNPIYRASYSLQGLREQLDRGAGGRPAERHAAWPRLMSLFRLVYHGSQHERLLIPRYGGGLFLPCHDPEREQPLTDPVDLALAALEHPDHAPSDAVVAEILDLLTRSRVRVRQGRRSTWVMAPVDFSDLSSEYIGILYEGLLDFELRQAPADDAMVFLDLGSQPVLPFARLDAMTEKEMVNLLTTLRAAAKSAETDDEEPEDDDDSTDEQEPDLPPADRLPIADELDDQRRLFAEKVQIWAEKAVKAAELVKYGKSASPRRREAYEAEARAAARSLYKIVFPGEWYLVRWGGTRKGSGTFYTRPQLAGPTTRRALQPLLYMRVSEGDQVREVIRRPEQILALKVCDPAMGSGSFLIAALRVLVDALFLSLHEHGRLVDRPRETLVRLADGLPLDHPSQESIPVPRDAPDFESRLRARLKRHVVERCLHGVELDPLAVELARMAIWLETMDYQLPFEFLDHKLRCGNSLVGAWLDRVLDFPALCCERAAGDEYHDAVHVEKGARTRALRQYRNDRLKPELRRFIQDTMNRVLGEAEAVADLRHAHARALAALKEIHELPIWEAELREAKYTAFKQHPEVIRLRAALDRWCALWFWNADQIDEAPGPLTLRDLDAPTPLVDRLRDRLRFFHWELEFPDVFSGPGAGFDIIVGNPPWETQKPSSMEFFSNLDPLYRTYDKQHALRRQRELFAIEPEIERDWLDYVGQFAALSNWFLCVAWPFGDGKFTGKGETFNMMAKPGQWRDSDKLHIDWQGLRKDRPNFSDPNHPFQHQGGSDINSYKLFLEQSYRLLRADGRLGFVVPAGIYADKASIELRRVFLEQSRWTHIYGFQNERYVFGGIHHSYKTAVLAVTKGGQTQAILTRFRIGPGDSPEAHEIEEDLLADDRFFDLRPEKIREFSPNSGTILEIRDRRDLVILEKVYSNGVLLGDPTVGGWQAQCSTEFHMTNDSKLMPPRPRWEALGYRPSAYGCWLKGAWKQGSHSHFEAISSADDQFSIDPAEIDGVAVPLCEGRMIGQFEAMRSYWIEGKGRTAVWKSVDYTAIHRRNPGPQFLVSRLDFLSGARRGVKLAYMDVASSINSRTMIASLVSDVACVDSTPVLSSSNDAVLCGFLNSFAFDYCVRFRSTGLHLKFFALAETPIAPLSSIDSVVCKFLEVCCLSLTFGGLQFAHIWLPRASSRIPWRRLWAVTPHERLRLRSILDAVVAHLYGLTAADFAWILRDCDHPVESVCNARYARRFDPKGFWRVDKDQLPELRHPVLAQIAFRDLQARGLDAFLAQNDGEGWMLPETLRLADHGLGHDDRAAVAQPVAEALGPRFLPWQLEQSVEESWDECRRHAERIAQIVPSPPPREPAAASTTAAKPVSVSPPAQTDIHGNTEPVQRRLFDLDPPPRRRKPK